MAANNRKNRSILSSYFHTGKFLLFSFFLSFSRICLLRLQCLRNNWMCTINPDVMYKYTHTHTHTHTKAGMCTRSLRTCIHICISIRLNNRHERREKRKCIVLQWWVSNAGTSFRIVNCHDCKKPSDGMIFSSFLRLGYVSMLTSFLSLFFLSFFLSYVSVRWETRRGYIVQSWNRI